MHSSRPNYSGYAGNNEWKRRRSSPYNDQNAYYQNMDEMSAPNQTPEPSSISWNNWTNPIHPPGVSCDNDMELPTNMYQQQQFQATMKFNTFANGPRSDHVVDFRSQMLQKIFPISQNQVDFKPSVDLAPTIRLPTCTLYRAESFHAPKIKPNGCTSIMITDLPTSARNDKIIHEIFGRFGEIDSVRYRHGKCYVRYVNNTSADTAVTLNGFRIRVRDDNQPNNANSGEIFVDYSLDDNIDDSVGRVERKSRARSGDGSVRTRDRSARSRDRSERSRDERTNRRERVASPHFAALMQFSQANLQAIIEKFRNCKDQTDIVDAVEVREEIDRCQNVFLTPINYFKAIKKWLEKGNCCRANADSFYMLLQMANFQVKRLHETKMISDKEFELAGKKHDLDVKDFHYMMTAIEGVLNAAFTQKAWDSFTGKQRKQIEMWKADMQKTTEKLSFLTMLSVNHRNDRMDLEEISDDDRESFSGKKSQMTDQLREENEQLKAQLESVKKNMEIVSTGHKIVVERKDMELKMLQETVKRLTQERVADAARVKEEEKKRANLKVLNPLDERIFALLVTYLNAHTFPLDIASIYRFVECSGVGSVKMDDVEMILERFPAIFMCQPGSKTATRFQKKWLYVRRSSKVVLD